MIKCIGWTVLILRNVIYIVPNVQKKSERELRPYGIHGIHFWDSGNYHYVTGIMTTLIKQKISLILLDHHTDMQKPMIEQMTSWGDWAGKVLKTNPWLVRSRNKPVSDNFRH